VQHLEVPVPVMIMVMPVIAKAVSYAPKAVGAGVDLRPPQVPELVEGNDAFLWQAGTGLVWPSVPNLENRKRTGVFHWQNTAP
jgi:hypothetical protein